MAWRRRVERDGVWWAQGRDGAWSRWDTVRNDWVPEPGGPPGGAPPLEPEGSGIYAPPADGPGAAWIARDFVRTFGGLALPAALGLGAALVIVWPVALIWNTLFVPWLGDPIEVTDALVLMLVGTLAVALFAAIATTISHAWSGTAAWVTATVVFIAGTAGTVAAIAAASGLGVGELLGRTETAMAALLVGGGWLIARWRRHHAE
jgi:hypothetical protein